MDRNRYDISNNKVKFIAIGAGALVLALIAFSGLSWCAIMACGRQLASIPVGYWELLGGSSIAALAVLFIRPLRDRVLPRQLRSESRISPPPGADPAVKADYAVKESQLVVVEPAGSELDKQSSWRTMYDQLSQDERQMFKSIMKKVCDSPPEAENCSNGETPPEPE